MKRFKVYYEVKRDLEVGEEIIEAKTKEDAEQIFAEIVEAAPFDLVYSAGCPTPEYFEIKKTNIAEVTE
jgi:hypothetical protein